MLWIQLIASTLTSLIAFLTISIIHIWKDKRTKIYKRVKRILIVLMIISTLITWLVVYNNYQEAIQQRDQLKDISDKLDPILEYSRETYPGKKDEEALKSILYEIQKLSDLTLNFETRTSKAEDNIKAIKQYNDVALWNFWGDIETGGGVNFSSPVSHWTDKYVSKEGGDVSWQCNSDALTHYKSFIDKHPRYPFPYVLVSLCLKQAGHPSWRRYASEGYDILTKTTSIANHAPSHDQALKMLDKAMKDGK